MSSGGVIEELQDKVRELESVIVKLCAKTGHVDSVSAWRRCDNSFHRRYDKYLTDPIHATKCDVCGRWKCLHEEEGA